MQQDQLLLVWLLSSISESVVSQVIHCTTSSELWHELTVRFKKIVDRLRMIGCPVSDADLQLFILMDLTLNMIPWLSL
jgi:hypothetical protein